MENHFIIILLINKSIFMIFAKKSVAIFVLLFGIIYIEDALKSSKTWNEWKFNLINKFDNGTENHVEALFGAWN